MFSGLPQVADIVRSAFQYLANPPDCGSRVLGRAIPCSDLRQQRRKIIRKRVALLRDKSVSAVSLFKPRRIKHPGVAAITELVVHMPSWAAIDERI
jgi:hypothetical protein